MTKDTEKRKSDRILEKIRNRKEKNKSTEAEEEKNELVIFRLAEDYYAFFGSDINEILPYESVTFVPGCPEYITGIINVRGDIESVLDLHRLMGLSPAEPTKQSRIIIGSKGEIRSGILVDSVEDVISVSMSSVKRPIATLDKRIKDFSIGGETIYEEKYVSILDIEKIFEKMQE